MSMTAMPTVSERNEFVVDVGGLRGLGRPGREPAQIRWPGAFSQDGAPILGPPMIRRSAPSSPGRWAWRLLTFRNATSFKQVPIAGAAAGPSLLLDLAGIEWVIVGGRVGRWSWTGARYPGPLWRSGSDAVPQAGRRPSPRAGGRLLDGRTWDQYPASDTIPELVGQ